MYNWQQRDWPNFRYNTNAFDAKLIEYSQRQERIDMLFDGLSQELQTETTIALMVNEAMKTSEIEGEFLNRDDVAATIRNKFGLERGRSIKDQMAKGAGELMVMVQNSIAKPLTEHMLFEWHGILLASAKRINQGQWREHRQPMQIVSGAWGREKVVFEAPPSSFVPKEMSAFTKWFNNTHPDGIAPIKEPIVRSAIAHLYFETIHPFEDGNGRMGRAISEKALSQNGDRPVLMSLSSALEPLKKEYFNALLAAQKSNEITEWIFFFIDVVLQAQKNAEVSIALGSM
ncbi:MAG: DUF4172 domain-containing protein [Leeuwenhoekiella sp.]